MPDLSPVMSGQPEEVLVTSRLGFILPGYAKQLFRTAEATLTDADQETHNRLDTMVNYLAGIGSNPQWTTSKDVHEADERGDAAAARFGIRHDTSYRDGITYSGGFSSLRTLEVTRVPTMDGLDAALPERATIHVQRSMRAALRAGRLACDVKLVFPQPRI